MQLKLKRMIVMHLVTARVAKLVIASSLVVASSVIAFGQVVAPTKDSGRVMSQSTDATIETPTGSLSGTLLLSSGKAPFPVVLIVAGSGPTDRDGNTVGSSRKSDRLRLLAEGLARQGIGSLRYDKRGVAKSAAARLATNSFDTQVDDAALLVAWLHRDSRFSTVGIVGHSEGALVGTIAAQRGGANALVLLAGAGKRVDDVLVEQMERAIQAGQLSKSSLSPFKSALAELRAGRTVNIRPKDIPDVLWNGLFQPRALEYLISLIRYDPPAELAKLPKLGIRLLVVQGTTDLTGSVENATLLAAAIGEKPVLINGMNHELRSAPLDQKANDAASENPKLPLAIGLLEKVIPFLTASIGAR